MKENQKTDSELLTLFKNGNKAAADELLNRYYDRVVNAANRRIGNRKLRATGSEDVAMSVFESLWKKADQNHFSDNDLTHPDEFWRLICTMVRYKTEDHFRRENTEKRGSGRVRGNSVFGNPEHSRLGGIENESGGELTPEENAAFRDQLDALLKRLDNLNLQAVATMRLENYKVQEIAQHFGKSDRWVKRQLSLIREIWINELEKNP